MIIMYLGIIKQFPNVNKLLEKNKGEAKTP